ncbi:hypothetical protein GGTG_02081 [Gaeumannomyces tritici R3-111a-1]|uniref:Uncharacterized protein n=1 Tax=Gaeumannomyces tritici (strain R3-111a-1) TaxID=644352 RepID=J3NLD3_GAET3|nr:hypothetical protein GGTG_02081 [Gaeumannomyces tritici R3-111a-1]EJT82107.1 hypothetical protein GGTG_02081 [Gaeumannomyces tritici R3-111a-1]
MSSRFTGEVVAGVAVGSAAIAALVAGLVVYFIWRSRSKKLEGQSKKWKAELDKLVAHLRGPRDIPTIMSGMIYECGSEVKHMRFEKLASFLMAEVNQLVARCTTNRDGPFLFDASAYTAAAGDEEDWGDLLNRSWEVRGEALTAIIMRVLIRRMHPDGPCHPDESLLPPDIVHIHHASKAKKQALQQKGREFLTKKLGDGYTREEFFDFTSGCLWRFIVTYLTTEVTPHEGFEFPMQTATFKDDDPRLPAAAKLEELIVRLMTPFDMPAEELAQFSGPEWKSMGNIGSEVARSTIRDIAVCAAGLALKMFSGLYFAEFYFPPDMPPTQPNGDRRILLLPPIRARVCIPGAKKPPPYWNFPEPDGSRWVEISPPALSYYSLQGTWYESTSVGERNYIPLKRAEHTELKEAQDEAGAQEGSSKLQTQDSPVPT